ncbi:unnamed protein product, partial [Urochloa humidicola]
CSPPPPPAPLACTCARPHPWLVAVHLRSPCTAARATCAPPTRLRHRRVGPPPPPRRVPKAGRPSSPHAGGHGPSPLVAPLLLPTLAAVPFYCFLAAGHKPRSKTVQAEQVLYLLNEIQRSYQEDVERHQHCNEDSPQEEAVHLGGYVKNIDIVNAIYGCCTPVLNKLLIVWMCEINMDLF